MLMYSNAILILKVLPLHLETKYIVFNIYSMQFLSMHPTNRFKIKLRSVAQSQWTTSELPCFLQNKWTRTKEEKHCCERAQCYRYDLHDRLCLCERFHHYQINRGNKPENEESIYMLEASCLHLSVSLMSRRSPSDGLCYWFHPRHLRLCECCVNSYRVWNNWLAYHLLTSVCWQPTSQGDLAYSQQVRQTGNYSVTFSPRCCSIRDPLLHHLRPPVSPSWLHPFFFFLKPLSISVCLISYSKLIPRVCYVIIFRSRLPIYLNLYTTWKIKWGDSGG